MILISIALVLSATAQPYIVATFGQFLLGRHHFLMYLMHPTMSVQLHSWRRSVSCLPFDRSFSFPLISDKTVGWRFKNLHGQHGARSKPQQTVHVPHEMTAGRTLLIRLLSPLLFFAPDRNLQRLRLINPVDFLNSRSWSPFIASWEKSWNDYILYVCRAAHGRSLYSHGCFILRLPSC